MKWINAAPYISQILDMLLAQEDDKRTALGFTLPCSAIYSARALYLILQSTLQIKRKHYKTGLKYDAYGQQISRYQLQSAFKINCI